MSVRTLRDLSERDAQRHLDRYVREIPARMRALHERACAERPHLKPDRFDRSAESLVAIWEWMVHHVTRKLPAEFPAPDPWWVPDEPGAAIDPDLVEWSDRIGLYVAHCFKGTYADRGIRWKLGSGATDSAVLHQPVLSGFTAEFCPRLRVYELALKIPQGIHAGRMLCDAFEMWSDDVLPPRAAPSPHA